MKPIYLLIWILFPACASRQLKQEYPAPKYVCKDGFYHEDLYMGQRLEIVLRDHNQPVACQ